jgi:glutamine synthetase
VRSASTGNNRHGRYRTANSFAFFADFIKFHGAEYHFSKETAMPSLDRLIQLIEENKIEYIDLKFSDLIGSWHHISLPVTKVEPDLFKLGVGVDGSSLPGFARIERGDMVVLPDAETAFIDPFFDIPTLSFICDIMEVEDGIEPY